MNNTTTGLNFTESRLFEKQVELDQLEQMDNESLIESGLKDDFDSERESF